MGDVNGVGLMAGMELVEDRESRKPLDPERKIMARLEQNGRERGLVMRLIGDRIALAPPFIITESEIDEMVSRPARRTGGDLRRGLMNGAPLAIV